MGVKEYAYKGHFVAVLDRGKCTDCGICFEYCQFGAIAYSKELESVNIDVTKCMGCGLCHGNCPNEAITMVPRADIPIAKDLW